MRKKKVHISSNVVRVLPAALVITAVLSTSWLFSVSGYAILALEHTELWTENDLPPSGMVDAGDIYAADLDGDSVVEIISIGKTTHAALGVVAELRIGSWYGEAFKLLKEEEWQIEASDTFGRAVYCADVDGDGTVEILTLSEKVYMPIDKGELKIWNWDRATNTLNVEVSRVWDSVYVYDIAAMDVDGDGAVEIVIAGNESTYAQLRVLKWDGHALTEEHVENWQNTEFYGVGLGDLDMDGLVEIATAGFYGDPAQIIDLHVWRWSGVMMTPLASAQWKTMDASTSLKIAFGDLDGDGLMEMVTAGRSSISGTTFGLITIWNWDGVHLDLKAHDEWQSSGGATEFFSAYAGDVDGDGVADAIVAGAVHEIPGENVLRVYRWDGVDLEAKYSEVWIGTGMSHSFAYTVYSKDVDGDGTIEILTGGRGVGPPEIGGILSDHGEIDIWGVPVPVSSVRSSIIEAAAGSVYYIYPATAETGGVKDPDVIYASAADWSATGMILGMSANGQNIGLDSDGVLCSTSNGQPLSSVIGSGQAVVMVSGPIVHAGVHYYEVHGVGSDKAPVYFAYDSNNFYFKRSSDNTVLASILRSQAGAGTDIFLIEVFTDANGRTVFIVYGFTYLGTLAASTYFKFTVYPALSTYTQSYYLIRWTDAPSGLSHNGIPDMGDTYTPITSG